MGLSLRSRFAALAAPLVVIAAAALSLPAEAAARPCGDFEAKGRTWVIGGGGTSCKHMRSWARRFMRSGNEPRGWDCHGRKVSARTHGCEERRGDGFFIWYPPH